MVPTVLWPQSADDEDTYFDVKIWLMAAGCSYTGSIRGKEEGSGRVDWSGVEWEEQTCTVDHKRESYLFHMLSAIRTDITYQSKEKHNQ